MSTVIVSDDGQSITIVDSDADTVSVSETESQVVIGDASESAPGPPGPTGAAGADGAPGAVGPRGPTGQRGGSPLLSGSGPPDPGLGIDGDFYIDPTLKLLYGPKAGVWPPPVDYTIAAGPTGPAGPAGPTGPAGTGTSVLFTFTQDVSSSLWLIGHNLGVFPNVTTADTLGRVIEADVVYIDANNITAGFAVATTGTAYLS